MSLLQTGVSTPFASLKLLALIELKDSLQRLSFMLGLTEFPGDIKLSRCCQQVLPTCLNGVIVNLRPPPQMNPGPEYVVL